MAEWAVLWLTAPRTRASISSILHAAGREDPNSGGIGEDPMNAQQLLQEISDYCRHTGLAESTFGRRAVNDGKLANRLRNGGRITTDTLDRIRAFMVENRSDVSGRPALIPRAHETRPATSPMPSLP